MYAYHYETVGDRVGHYNQKILDFGILREVRRELSRTGSLAFLRGQICLVEEFSCQGTLEAVLKDKGV